LEGCVPLSLKFDTVGPLTKSVGDAGLLFSAMLGRPAFDMRDVSLKGRRFAALQSIVLDDIRDAPLAAYDSAVERLRAAGAEVVPVGVPELEGEAGAMAMAGPLFPGEVYGLWRDVIEANADAVYGEILERFRSGANFSAPDYHAAWARLEAARKAWATKMSYYDAVLAPTAPILPPNLERLNSDSDYYKTENLLALRNTRVGNLMGLCALTLPTGVPSCGIMLMGAPNCEEALVRVGIAAERALK
jgi:aspartyl-tRNA(Asn)/glutamyl-tRNA(Gln) amidotransferase subunit A